MISIENLLTFVKSFHKIRLIGFLLFIIRSTILTISIILSVYLIYLVACFAISPEYRQQVLSYFHLSQMQTLLGTKNDDATRYSEKDYNSVLPDHGTISQWVQHCMGIKPDMEVPVLLTSQFWLPSIQYRVSLGASDNVWPKTIQQLTREETALVQLSDAISEQRLALTVKVRSAYSFWEYATIFSIVIGMITTILVSVSSTEFGRGGGHTQRMIRVLAIIFPVLGTATAAVINFYSPQAEWGQVSRTLASLTQLHGQMALAVWKLKCPPTGTDDSSANPLTSALDDWSKRYVDIQTIASATGASGAGQGGGPSGGGQDGGGPSASGIRR